LVPVRIRELGFHGVRLRGRKPGSARDQSAGL